MVTLQIQHERCRLRVGKEQLHSTNHINKQQPRKDWSQADFPSSWSLKNNQPTKQTKPTQNAINYGNCLFLQLLPGTPLLPGFSFTHSLNKFNKLSRSSMPGIALRTGETAVNETRASASLGPGGLWDRKTKTEDEAQGTWTYPHDLLLVLTQS